jgi:hypothetical protein
MQLNLRKNYGENGSDIDEFLTSRFSSIFFEAKDIYHEHIKTVPMGFTNFYLLQLPIGFVEERIEEAKNVEISDKKLAFAGWGKVWAILDKIIPDRRDLATFLSKETTQRWVTRQHLEFEEYWRGLMHFKFALSPRGNGIQAPKIFEAMLLRVVPVVTRVAAFDDLVELGFPILVIDEWDILTPEFLEQMYESKFAHVDWDRVYRMITREGVWSLLMDGEKYPF